VIAYELFSALAPSVVNDMLDWFRANDRNVYKSAVATLASHRKLRPVFVERKPLSEQYAWIHKSLASKTSNSIGEHLLQAFLMAGQQKMLATFCDGLGISHDGNGSVSGDLPETIDRAALDKTIDQLVTAHDPKIITLYLHCFNMQKSGGWPEITEKIASDERLVLA
jgi:hypothetical protein